MKTINGIPVYSARIEGEEQGMLRVSLVDRPAVDSDFVALAKADVPQRFAVQDEERRIIRGPIMRADYPIYRLDEELGEYYIVYDAQTIRHMAQKYLAEFRQNNVDIMHRAGSDVEGVEMVQLYIKDTAAGIAPAGFDDIADGSLFAEYHVLNDDVWAAVKAGTFRGFSLEGYFSLVSLASADVDTEAKDIEEIERLVDKLIKRITDKP